MSSTPGLGILQQIYLPSGTHSFRLTRPTNEIAFLDHIVIVSAP